jgi:hypothetical protein
LFHSLLPGDNCYAGVPASDVTDSVGHAKSLSDVWIDTVANVGAYWLAERALTHAAAASSGGGGTTFTWTLPAHFPAGKYLRVTVSGGTLRQGAAQLVWNGNGFYEVALDAGSLSWSP